MSFKRFIHLGVVLALLVLALVARLAQLQLLEHDDWLQAAESSRTAKRAIPFMRGPILDARGKELARDRDAFDLHLVYRDFRRGDTVRNIPGNVAAQLLEGYGLLGTQIRAERFNELGIQEVSLVACFSHALGLGAGLLKLKSSDVSSLRTDQRSDLGFYLRHLFGLTGTGFQSWLEGSKETLGEAFPQAQERFEERVALATRDLERLERQLEMDPGEFLQKVEKSAFASGTALATASGAPGCRIQFQSVGGRGSGLHGRIAGGHRPGKGPEADRRGFPRGSDRPLEAGCHSTRCRSAQAFAARGDTGRTAGGGPKGSRAGSRAAPGRIGAGCYARLKRLHPKTWPVLGGPCPRTCTLAIRLLRPDIKFDAVDLLIRNAKAYPGLRVLEKPRRMYPDSTTLTLVGRAVEQQSGQSLDKQREEAEEFGRLARNLHRSRAEDARYMELRDRVRREHSRLGETHGVSGIELAYDEALRGKRGFLDSLHTDTGGEDPQELDFVPPVHGRSLHLSLDTELVRAAERAIAAGYRQAQINVSQDADMDSRLIPGLNRPRAGMVLLNLEDGSVPVLATLPTFSAEDMRRNFNRLAEDPDRPLSHRALGFNYGPGIEDAVSRLHFQAARGLRSSHGRFQRLGPGVRLSHRLQEPALRHEARARQDQHARSHQALVQCLLLSPG